MTTKTDGTMRKLTLAAKGEHVHFCAVEMQTAKRKRKRARRNGSGEEISERKGREKGTCDGKIIRVSVKFTILRSQHRTLSTSIQRSILP